MTIEQDNWDVDQWELDECRYCKGPIEDPSEAYCSASCELKWMQQQDEQGDNSPTGSSVFSAHPAHSLQSTPRSTPLSSAHSSPEFQPILPAGSVPVLPLDFSSSTMVTSTTSTTAGLERRNSYALRTHTYGSSHNPIKKSFPSNYYQSTVGDRASFQPIFADKSISLGIRKNSTDDMRPKSTITITTTSTDQSSRIDEKPSDPPSPTSTTSNSSRSGGLWSWRRLSALI